MDEEIRVNLLVLIVIILVCPNNRAFYFELMMWGMVKCFVFLRALGLLEVSLLINDWRIFGDGILMNILF